MPGTGAKGSPRHDGDGTVSPTSDAVYEKDLAITPYVIYRRAAPLAEEDITELAKWAAGQSVFKLVTPGPP